jgi:hypothetical protein
MIPVPSGVRVWLAVGRTDMRRGNKTCSHIDRSRLPARLSPRRRPMVVLARRLY